MFFNGHIRCRLIVSRQNAPPVSTSTARIYSSSLHTYMSFLRSSRAISLSKISNSFSIVTFLLIFDNESVSMGSVRYSVFNSSRLSLSPCADRKRNRNLFRRTDCVKIKKKKNRETTMSSRLTIFRAPPATRASTAVLSLVSVLLPYAGLSLLSLSV